MFKFLKNKSKNKQRRAFTQTQKIKIFYNQNCKCKMCGEPLDLRTVKYDHIVRWSQGGATDLSNGQALCANCHSIKTFDENIELINKKDAKIN